MKLRKLTLTVLIMGLLTVSGCGRVVQTPPTAVDPTATPAVTAEPTAEPTAAPTAEPTPEPTPEPTEEPIVEPTQDPIDDPFDDPIITTENNENFFRLFTSDDYDNETDGILDELDETTGYISSDAETVDKILEYTDATVMPLSSDNIASAEDSTLFRFKMLNQETAQEVPSSDGSAYLTTCLYNNEIFFLLFGSDTGDFEEIEIFTQVGTTIEYWAMAVENDGLVMLLPLFAGNEENGYYIVRPTFAVTGIDMSNTKSLVEQGIDFTTSSDPVIDDPEIDDPDINTPDVDVTTTTHDITSGELSASVDDFTITVTSYEISGTESCIVFDITNGLDEKVYLTEEVLILNGEDITDNTIWGIVTEANESTDDYMFIQDHVLTSGDKITIRCNVTGYDSDTEYGTFELNFVIE